jgi:hypothetical protein
VQIRIGREFEGEPAGIVLIDRTYVRISLKPCFELICHLVDTKCEQTSISEAAGTRKHSKDVVAEVERIETEEGSKRWHAAIQGPQTPVPQTMLSSGRRRTVEVAAFETSLALFCDLTLYE